MSSNNHHLDSTLLLLSSLLVLFFSSLTTTTAATACPLDLNYVVRIPWNRTLCRNYQPEKSENNTTHNNPKNPCCQAVLSLYGISLAIHLKETSQFHLENLATSVSCLQDFQTKLTALALPSNLVSDCLDPDRYVITPDICAHIETTRDWVAKLGASTILDSACRPDLTDLTSCGSCVEAGFQVQSVLVSIDGNKTHATDCFYFAVLYAAGIVNEFGPESDGAVSCIFGLQLNDPPKLSNYRSGLSNKAISFGLGGAGVAVLLVCGFVGYCLWYYKRWKKKGDFGISLEEQYATPKLRPNTGSIWFKFDELEKATDNFSQKNFVGRGGYGFVYKGVLSDGSVVAIKRIIESDFQGDADFCNEVEIISNLRHRNLVPLRGCCVVDGSDGYGEGGCQRFLIYDYMPNGNLEDHLFPSSSNRAKKLTWPRRQSIILDVAKGLAYLHYGVKPAIFHRDIKGMNILLDSDMRARVADFGLAKQSREGQSHLTTRVAGTHGYLAPEYALYGQLTEKSDVYSFGIVVLEIVCGRKVLDMSSSGSAGAFLITDWVWSLVKSGRAEEALDSSLLRDDDATSLNAKGIMERFLLVGILCAHVMVALRPTIVDALKMLEGDIDVPSIPDRPMPFGHPSFHYDDNAFNNSSALSGPQLNTGEMLRKKLRGFDDYRNFDGPNMLPCSELKTKTLVF